MSIRIQLDEYPMWGGVIPDILRHDHISLRFGEGVVIRLSGKDFARLRKLMNDTAERLYNDAAKLIETYDRKDEAARTIDHVLQGVLDDLAKLKSDASRKAWEALFDIKCNFYSEYWR